LLKTDTRDDLSKKVATTSGILDDIDLRHLALVFFDPRRENAKVRSEELTSMRLFPLIFYFQRICGSDRILPLLEGLPEHEIADLVLFEFQEAPDADAFAALSGCFAADTTSPDDLKVIQSLLFAPNLSVVSALFRVTTIRDLDPISNSIYSLFSSYVFLT
jgi:hypothetical protein